MVEIISEEQNKVKRKKKNEDSLRDLCDNINMSIDRWIGKEVVCTHNGILLSHKKECLWVSYNEVDEPITYYTVWSELGRER